MSRPKTHGCGANFALAWLLLFACNIACIIANQECSFPDSDISGLQVDSDRIFYTTGCKRWTCVEEPVEEYTPAFTGQVCEFECSDATICPVNDRVQTCDSPLQTSCIACQQDGSELVENGYSFTEYSQKARKYELLQERGSFEYAKLYPAFQNRLAGEKTAMSFVQWNDVMFSDPWVPVTWYGIGETKILRTDPAMGSKGTTHYVTLKNDVGDVGPKGIAMCGLLTRVSEETGAEHIGGIVYKFSYKQLMKYQEIGVKSQLQSAVSPTSISGEVFASLYNLPSETTWTTVEMLVDFARKKDDLQTLDDTACLVFEFVNDRDIYLDELLVFVNLLSNSDFIVNPVDEEEPHKAWACKCSVLLEENCVTYVEDGMLPHANFVKIHNGYLQQRLLLLDDTTPGSVAGTLSMYVRGNAQLRIAIMRSGDDLVIVRKRIESPEWTKISFPIRLDEIVAPDYYNIRIVANKILATDYLDVDRIVFYVDKDRCPIGQCDDAFNRVLLNGRCEKCTITEGTCAKENYQVGCIVMNQDAGMRANCAGCEVPKYYETLQTAPLASSISGGSFISTARECSYMCTSGFYFHYGSGPRAKNTVLYESPKCVRCTPRLDLSCGVGFYAAECTSDMNAQCLPCGGVDVSDDSVVHTTENAYSRNKYENSKDDQCTYSCTSGQVNLARIADGGTSGFPLCFPCTLSVCGLQDYGISTLRIMGGLQYTRQCTTTVDAQCERCHSDDSAVEFITNGNTVGTWCDYNCAPGSAKCRMCGWDPLRAQQVQHVAMHTFSVENPSIRHAVGVPYNISLDMIRISASVVILNAEFGVDLQLRVRMDAISSTGGPTRTWEIPNNDGIVQTWYPIVTSTALASMHTYGSSVLTAAPTQKIDFTISISNLLAPSDTNQNFVEWSTQRANDIIMLVYELGPSVPQTTGINVKSFLAEALWKDGLPCCGVLPGVSVNAFAALFTDNTASPIEPSTVQRCNTCETAKDLTTGLPANSHWESVNDCSWSCNSGYEVQGNDVGICGECKEPTCIPGEYWTSCGTCAPCRSAPDHANFTSVPSTRYDNASCSVECNIGYYYDAVDHLCLPCTVLACDNKPGGPFYEEKCSAFNDAHCMDCTMCLPGFNASSQCSSFHDATCSPCQMNLLTMPNAGTNMGAASVTQWILGSRPDEYCAWECARDMLYNSRDNSCVVCQETCDVSFYPTDCTLSNGYTGCAPCVVPENAQAISTGVRARNASCSWNCNEGFFYNRTSEKCNRKQAVVAEKLVSQALPSPCGNPGVCGWASFMDTSIILLEGRPCTDKCKPCPALPKSNLATPAVMAVHTRKGFCDWVCATPLILVNGECVQI